MKILRYFILGLSFVMSGTFTFGQDSKWIFGVSIKTTYTYFRGSISPPDFTSSTVNPYDFAQNLTPMYSFALGLNTEYALSSRFTVKSGLFYERKGAWHIWDNSYGEYIYLEPDKKMVFDYLIMPLTMSYQTKGKVKFFAESGLFTGFLLQQQDVHIVNGELLEKVNNTDQFSRFDFGFTLGIGIRIPIQKRLVLDIGLYNYSGLIDINKSYFDPRGVMRTCSNGFQIGLTYKF